MSSQFENLRQRMKEIEVALEAELEEKRRKFRYRLERSRVVFETDVLSRHREARESLRGFLSRTRLLVLLTAPFIYILIVPLLLLDLLVSIYHAVCFPVYGVPKVRRHNYIVIDRQQLAYLNGLQKLNCIYCGYANGLIGWVREVASRTEAYWCPIKHSKRIAEPHQRYPGFIDFGDEHEFPERVQAIRKALGEETQVK